MVKARVTMWIVLFVGIVMNMLNSDIMYITILSMVKNGDSATSQRSQMNNYSDRIVCGYYNENSMNLSATAIQTDSDENLIISRNDSRLEWSKADKNLVLSGGSWIGWIGHFCAGLLMHRYGVKMVVGYSTIMCAILSFLTPLSAFISPMAVAFVAGMKGFFVNLAFPVSAIMLIGKWSPLEERGKFMSVFIAIPLGLSLNFVLCPFISNRIGWPYAFHTVGILSLVWCLSWWYYVYDTAEEHPRIDDEEKNYIKCSIGKDVSFEKRLPIPWKQILTSVPFYIIVSNHFSFMWLAGVTGIYGPTYFYDWFGFSSEKSGMIFGASQILRAVFCYFGGVVTDAIIKRKTFSITNVRKMWTVLGAVVPGLSLLLIVFCSCNASLAIIGIVINVVFRSFFTVGMSTSIIDLSPNFCNILQSVCSTVSFSAGLVVVVFVQFVSRIYRDTYTQWQIVFAVSMIIETVPAAVFLLFGDSEIQSWNNPSPTIGDPKPIRNVEHCYKPIPIVDNNNNNNDVNSSDLKV